MWNSCTQLYGFMCGSASYLRTGSLDRLSKIQILRGITQQAMQKLIEAEGEETRLPLTGCIQIIYPANNVNSLLPMLLLALKALNLPKHLSFILIYPYAYFFYSTPC